MSILLTIHREFTRVAGVYLIVAALLILDSFLPGAVGRAELSPLLTSSAMVLNGVALAQVCRRIVFPRINLQEQALKACGGNVAAALVVLGLVLFMLTIIICPVLMLR